MISIRNIDIEARESTGKPHFFVDYNVEWGYNKRKVYEVIK